MISTRSDKQRLRFKEGEGYVMLDDLLARYVSQNA